MIVSKVRTDPNLIPDFSSMHQRLLNSGTVEHFLKLYHYRLLSLFLVVSLLSITTGSSFAQIIWNGGGTDNNWTTSQNWSGGIAPTSSASTFVRFQGTVRPTPFTDTNSPWILNRIDFESRANPNPHSFTLSGNQLSFQGSSPEIYCYASAAQTVHNDIDIPGSAFTVDGLAVPSITLNGRLSGAGGLIVGYVSLSLSNSNTYQGTTTVGGSSLQGALTISDGQALGIGSSSVVVNLSSQLRLAGGITVTGKPLTLARGHLYNASGNNAWNGNVSLSASSDISSLSAGNTLTVTGNIDGGGSNLLQTGGVGDVVFSGAVTHLNTFGLEKYGSGTLTLSGVNSNIAEFLIYDGNLVIAANSAVPSGTWVDIEPFTGNINTYAYPTLTIQQDTTIAGLRGSSSGASVGGFSTVQLGSYNLTINQSFYANYAGVITGGGSIVKTGPGTLELDGSNTYSGGTLINGGAVRISSDSALGTPPGSPRVNVTLNSGELQTTNCAQITLDPNRTILLVGTGTLTVFGCVSAAPLIVPGQISGPGSLIKNGVGTVELSGSSNDYSGATTITAGVLQFDSPQAIGGAGADVQVNPGAVMAAGYPIDQPFLNRINPASQGTAALATDSTNNLDFASANLGQVALAAIGARSYGGMIRPSNGTYLLGGLNGVLNLTAKNALSGNASIQIGTDGSLVGSVLLSNNNNISGDAVVHGGVLKVSGSSLSCNQVEIKNQAVMDLAVATINANVTVDAGGLVYGCGTINGDLTNNGTVTIDCSPGLTVNGAIVNSGTLTILGGSALTSLGAFTNNGLLDLLTSPDTSLPPQFINNGTVIYPGVVNIRSISKQGSTFTLTAQSFTGHNYQLQKTSTLVDGNWQNVGSARAGATGTDVVLTDSASSGTEGFYRIQIAP